jgi:histidyl-tRNA synthetase
MFKRPRGTRDLGPEEMARRRYAEGKFRSVCQSFGFKEIATPTFETTELFLAKSGEGIIDEIYAFQDKGGRELALRPELTAPVMRFYASELKQLPKPLKLYYFGNCFRYERPQSGRYREFWQFGVELIGPEGPLADAELLALGVECLNAVGLKDFILRIGDLRVLGGLLDKLGITGEERSEMLRYIDKGDTASLESFIEARCPDGKDAVLQLVSLKGGSEILGQAESLLKGIETSAKALDNLKDTTQFLQQYGIEDVQVDLGIARGLDYYTGMVFEIDAPMLGSENQLCGGGEYSLAKLFGAQEIPTRGFAFGFDRVLLALEKSGVTFPRGSLDAYIVPIGDKARQKAIYTLRNMRASGISADMDFMGRSLSKAMKYTDTLNATYVIILGERDLEKGMATVRNMKTGEQSEVKLDSLNDFIKN